MIIAHIINPVKVFSITTSYPFHTQPLTFESMLYSYEKYVENKYNIHKINLYSLNSHKMIKLYLINLLNFHI